MAAVRRRDPTSLTLGFTGTGKVQKRNVYAQLDDHISQAPGDVRFILTASEEEGLWNPGLETVQEYAQEHNVPYDVLHDGTAPPEALNNARTTIRFKTVDGLVDKLISELVNATGQASLILLFEDDSKFLQNVLDKAQAKRIRALDLTHSLDELELVTVDDPAEPIDEEETAVATAEPTVETTEAGLDFERDWTEDELTELSRPQLEAVARAKGADIKKGMWKKNIIKSVLTAQERPAAPVIALPPGDVERDEPAAAPAVAETIAEPVAEEPVAEEPVVEPAAELPQPEPASSRRDDAVRWIMGKGEGEGVEPQPEPVAAAAPQVTEPVAQEPTVEPQTSPQPADEEILTPEPHTNGLAHVSINISVAGSYEEVKGIMAKLFWG